MKKALIPAVLIVAVVAAAILVPVFLRRRESPTPVVILPGNGKKPPAEAVSKRSPEDVLAELKGASAAGLGQKLDDLWELTGGDRKMAWKAALLGLGAREDVGTRIRAAQLARKLAVKKARVGEGKDEREVERLEAPDPAAIPALLSCLDSPDTELVHQSLRALGQLHLANPGMDIGAKVAPRLRELLACPQADLARSAVSVAPMFKDLGLADGITAAWEKHGKAEGFQTQCLTAMRILGKQRLKEAEQEAYPGKPDADCWKAAEEKIKALATKLGADPAKWKAWRTKSIGK